MIPMLLIVVEQADHWQTPIYTYLPPIFPHRGTYVWHNPYPVVKRDTVFLFYMYTYEVYPLQAP